MEDVETCDLCDKDIKGRAKIYVLEAPRKSDIEMCAKCATRVYKQTAS